jgi:hypothetical protein
MKPPARPGVAAQAIKWPWGAFRPVFFAQSNGVERNCYMKLFEVQNKVRGSGEYILGAKQTGSHACYLIYGCMKPKEKGRELRAGDGHEELFLAIQGDFIITGHESGTIKEGQAFHLTGEETYWLENPADATAVYILSGGHSEIGHH